MGASAVVSESRRAAVCFADLRGGRRRGTKPTLSAASVDEATRMRTGAVLLISLSCAGCAWSRKPVAQAPVPQRAATLQNPAPDADAAPAKFECSDGTTSVSQSGCLINIARRVCRRGNTNARRQHSGFLSERMTAVAQSFDYLLPRIRPCRLSEFLTEASINSLIRTPIFSCNTGSAVEVALDIGAVLNDPKF